MPETMSREDVEALAAVSQMVERLKRRVVARENDRMPAERERAEIRALERVLRMLRVGP